jgi:predicted house-cleaning noncanonical NTP pyrophosphatase (MazG superfamily)
MLSTLDKKYMEIKSLSGSRPTRVMMYWKLGKHFNKYLRKGWLSYLAGIGDLKPEERNLLGTAAEKFLAGLEQTKFDKAYKVPVILTFLTADGGIRPTVHLTEIARSMRDFYHGTECHQLDFHNKSNRDWRNWGNDKFADLAEKNPVYYLSQSIGCFFHYDKINQVFSLDKCLDTYLNPTLAFHIRDIMEYRRLKYFRGQYEVDLDILSEVATSQSAEDTEHYEQVKVYRKLIRDRIPEIIEAQGKRCEIRTLDDDEYRIELDRKLKEELDEYLAAKTVEELVDIAEVVLAIAAAKGLTAEEFEQVKIKRRKERGGFEKRLFLEKVIKEG